MWRTTCNCVNATDIARREFKRQKLRRQILLAAIGIVVLAALTVGVTRLRPAAPSVERGAGWTDTVKHGSMLRQVRGPHSLVPTQEAALRECPFDKTRLAWRWLVAAPASTLRAHT